MMCAAKCMVAGLLLVATSALGQTTNPYVSEEDRDVASDASRAVTEFCSGEFKGSVEAADAREDLLAAMGGENVILHAMTNATTWQEVGENLREDASVMWILPCVAAIPVLVIFLFCCWTCCPLRYFCRCCRCFARRRKTYVLTKLIALVMVLAVIAGIGASVIHASRGYSGLVDGVSNAACTSAEMLNITLQGKHDHPTFIGMIPVLNTFHKLEGTLDNGTAFMNNLTGILDRTFDVSKSVTLASQTLRLLEQMMANTQNNNPKDSGDNSMMHKCDFCQAVAEPLGQAADALSNSVGTALADTRAEVDAQLSWEKRQELQRTLRESTQPMIKFKDSFRDAFKPFVQPGVYDQFKEAIKREARGGVLVLFIFAFLLACCGCFSVSCCLIRESNGDNRKNPYHGTPHRCACVSWWFGFLYAFGALLMGGTLMFVSIPASSGCLAMDDINPATIEDIAPLLKLNLTGDNGEMLLDMVDHCINPSNTSENANLMDLIYERNGTSRITLRQRIVGMVVDPIGESLKSIQSRMNMSTGGLSSSQEIVSLRDLFRLNGVSSLLIADRDAMLQDTTMAQLALDTRAENGLAVGFATSMACSNHTVAGNMGDLTGQVIPGIDNFVGKLEYFGSLVDDNATCAAARVDCTGQIAATPNRLACDAGNSYMQLKEELQTAVQFRCDLFEDPSDPSQYCDPKDVATTGNDCLNADGTMTVKARFCSLAEFDTYVREFDTRIEVVMDRLDTVVADKTSAIDGELRELVSRFILGPVNTIVDGITCGWLANFYQSMIDGLCFQGVWGLRKIGQAYVLSGTVILFLVLVMYAVWRRTIDNVYNWASAHEVVPVNV